MLPEELVLDEFEMNSEYVSHVRSLRGNYKQQYWNLIPADSPELTGIPENGYTFSKFGSSRKKPKFKKYKTQKAVNYGVVTKEVLEMFLNRTTRNGERPFPDSEGIALCFGKRDDQVMVNISAYKHVFGSVLVIFGDGAAGENLSPCGIPKGSSGPPPQ
ncbi:MAG: hypothetical protein KF870_02325 [Leadbetterella sp.]|nr:hypothetical protein [Leadbetterella sp.]